MVFITEGLYIYIYIYIYNIYSRVFCIDFIGSESKRANSESFIQSNVVCLNLVLARLNVIRVDTVSTKAVFRGSYSYGSCEIPLNQKCLHCCN